MVMERAQSIRVSTNPFVLAQGGGRARVVRASRKCAAGRALWTRLMLTILGDAA
jgi:hypothetical protein